MAIKTINPYNNKEIKSFEEFSEEAVEKKIAQADKTYQKWKTIAIKQRAELLMNVASIFRKRKEELAKLITLEMGKLIAQSEAEVEMCASVYEYYAKNAADFLEDKPIEIKDGKAFVRYTPIGIILAVEPWNYPYNQVARVAAPNIMAGNVIMVKHASNVPQCAAAIEEIFREAGAEDGIYTNLFLSSSRIAKLAEDPRIVGLSLTGSEKAGASLAEAAGKNLKKSVLELGGSDPFIILEDADLEKAVKNAVKGRFGNMGQACTSSKRIIAVGKIADEFLEKFKEKVTGLKVGDPMERDTEVGPLSSEEAAQKIEKQVNDTVKSGAKLVLGGKRIDREGAFYEPTILTDIKPGMVAYHEEIFGPVASFYKVKDEKEAIALANDSTFGLGGSVFSENIDRAVEVASQIETGMVFINEHVASRPDLPFGGTKRSGYGRELSELGIEEFVNKKLIRISNK
ncbi:NAD-dependent succinate-semialdehyde dehydrogenase [Flavobacterium lindanitolerans]|uniref:Succinate-semialdehyde dehydrogenase/glutarate-semialdehyde dehydrogenase n=1 Tax=Flavobacterium lindanitolerans TaxID=428988 RepID=A0A497U1W4_9FLAO|nr:NAD-dependent succinate-semialdehyde dehydrogenase [Flavobacterium lindanitolerans]PKW30332.1 succinate-semialdehyde dehydrogenase/glutarate-semialdehyde dehydrogenase [Flavobacterium lindanitolerans]RLJ24670.1 succinate-semialdehyde dehydrogenase/glutarate-semialdehyde dehydrogenase [Flavobacterium lindanitolerans]